MGLAGSSGGISPISRDKRTSPATLVDAINAMCPSLENILRRRQTGIELLDNRFLRQTLLAQCANFVRGCIRNAFRLAPRNDTPTRTDVIVCAIKMRLGMRAVLFSTSFALRIETIENSRTGDADTLSLFHPDLLQSRQNDQQEART